MKRNLLFCALILLAVTALSAQSSEKITELINTEKTTYGQAAYMAAVFNGAVSEDASYEDSVKAMENTKLLPADAKAAGEISLSELCYIAVETAGLKGGLFYKLFPGPRYAFRELKAKGVLPPEADPSAKVNGRDLIAVFNGCLPDAE